MNLLGLDIAQSIDNVLLFTNEKVWNGAVLVNLLGDGIHLHAQDKYSACWEQIGSPDRLDIRDEPQLEVVGGELSKVAHWIREKPTSNTKQVSVGFDPDEGALYEKALLLRATGKDDLRVETCYAYNDWSKIIDLFELQPKNGEAPANVAFNPERLQRLGRIKAPEKPPVDLWFLDAPHGHYAMARVGPTFRAVFKALLRSELREGLGDKADLCMWPG